MFTGFYRWNSRSFTVLVSLRAIPGMWTVWKTTKLLPKEPRNLVFYSEKPEEETRWGRRGLGCEDLLKVSKSAFKIIQHRNRTSEMIVNSC